MGSNDPCNLNLETWKLNCSNLKKKIHGYRSTSEDKYTNFEDTYIGASFGLILVQCRPKSFLQGIWDYHSVVGNQSNIYPEIADISNSMYIINEYI